MLKCMRHIVHDGEGAGLSIELLSQHPRALALGISQIIDGMKCHDAGKKGVANRRAVRLQFIYCRLDDLSQ